MIIIRIVFLSVLFFAATALAQQNQPAATGAVWLDIFGGRGGAVIYPQYAWGINTRAGNFGGYGFVEVAPHEPGFTNHLVVYTPPKLALFSVHTETGGIPRKTLGFHQVGPRINVHEVVPRLKKPLHHLFVTALPRFIGIRPNNLLIAGATNRFKIAPGMRASVEGFHRFFAGNRPDYSEYWFLIHPKRTKHLAFGAFVLRDGGRTSLAYGIRLAP